MVRFFCLLVCCLLCIDSWVVPSKCADAKSSDSSSEEEKAEKGRRRQKRKQNTPEEINKIADYAWGYRYKNEISRAAALSRIAAIGSNKEAQSQYADMLYQGLGVQQNKKEAYHWTYEAAKNGNTKEISFLLSLIDENTLGKKFDIDDKEEINHLTKEIELLRKHS